LMRAPACDDPSMIIRKGGASGREPGVGWVSVEYGIEASAPGKSMTL